MERNDVTGEISKELGNLPNLTTLYLENNRLIDEVPFGLGDLKQLQFFILNQDNLTGIIHHLLSSLHSWINLQLASSDLSGQIPMDLFQIRN